MPKDQSKTRSRMQTARGLLDTQVPGATKSLGGLARRQAGARGFYRRAKAREQKRKAWLWGFMPLVNSNKAKSAHSVANS